MKWQLLLSTLWWSVSPVSNAELVGPWTSVWSGLDAEWRGQYKLRLTQGLENVDLRVLQHSLLPELDLTLPGDLRLHMEGRLRFDERDRLEPGSTNDSKYRSDWSRRHEFGDRGEAELLEFYVDGYAGDTFFRMGKQTIAWGAAIGLEVLDVVNPVTMREFVLPDRDERRIPLWAVNIERPVGDWMASFIWLPDTSYEQMPVPGAAFAIRPPAFLMQPDTHWLEADRPDDPISDADFGTQVTSFIAGWDVSLNYLYHYNDQPVLERQSHDTHVSVKPIYYRTHTLGGSLSNAFGDFTLRAEFGYDTRQYYPNADESIITGWSRSPEVSSVVGVDYSGVSDWLISTQLFSSYLPDYRSGLIRERRQDRATLLIRGDLFGHTQTAEMLVIHSLDQHDGIFQLAWDYRLRSHITLQAMLDIPYGRASGVFGQFRHLDQFSLGLEYSF
ncbi:DUF1302 family protein [Pseudohongiella sp. O18]|uniref:DUF1302 family protein n=1 Tax=Pseudohongiella sp. O18 TaxID=2904248 RepID=UPI001F16D272|nr:DUF1302 family protein [Pseudohongiella sp. O18]